MSGKTKEESRQGDAEGSTEKSRLKTLVTEGKSEETKFGKKIVKKVSFMLDEEEHKGKDDEAHIKRDDTYPGEYNSTYHNRLTFGIANGHNLFNPPNDYDSLKHYNREMVYHSGKKEEGVEANNSCLYEESNNSCHKDQENFTYKDITNDIVYETYDKHEFIEHEGNFAFSGSIPNGDGKNTLRGDNNNSLHGDQNNTLGDDGNSSEGNTCDEGKNKKKKEKAQFSFEQSYSDSLNNYLSSSFVNILNTLQEKKQEDEQKNGGVTISEYNNHLEENIQNCISIGGKNYEDKDFEDNMEKEKVRFINCILCGDSVRINNSKMCNNCILQSVESNSMNISKDRYLIYYCRECKRYLHNRWVYCELESKELLALCLKKVNKLKKLKILDAKFLYTESHSKRIKIHLTVQEELANNFISEMEIILNYIVKYTQCDDCKKKYTPYTYNTCVSVRQKVEHKKTLLFLESLLLKYNINENIINIVSNPDGLDFHFLSRTDALKFCDFILSKTMSKCKNSKHLINHDANNNTYNYLYSFAIDICPICKYDLIFFSKDLSLKYGIKSSFYLCIHVSIFIILINPFSQMSTVHISQERYNKYPFLPLLNKSDAKVFLILNVEHIDVTPRTGIGRTRERGEMNENSGIVNQGRKKRNLKRKKKNLRDLHNVPQVYAIEGDGNDNGTCNGRDNNDRGDCDGSDGECFPLDSLVDSKSCKSSSRKVKLEKLVYAYVELYDESNGNSILTKTCNAKHLKPGDYVNAYDLRKHTFDSDISLHLEKDDEYNIIIIDRVKSKEKQKIENELQVMNNNIETMKNLNDEDIFNRIVMNNCRDIENMTIGGV
ncbi:60S ribosomal export protein NMD3, putative [Plasmodium ovale]|uniref:60S ribosomal export protein NMD3, putative n=2 Tax=Plasmodium ovale TaxID=36330 RepID=A0A1D3KX89_PLAOA|nr:60S ribosomal export protein NMD3, putative (NMD3) [Plasmodium ovale curtisi]SBS80787.1 60S ribosomal export protein NMD3, putative (NMD3) [Plasmodium ovale curtisi]SCA48305.1 60S ribosomal export protein NMD3, putative [Plasmodium ovale]